MKILNTFKRRLIAANLMMVFVLCLFFSVGFKIAYEYAEDSLIDTHITDDIDSLMVIYRRDPSLAEAPNRSFLIHVAVLGDTSELPSYLQEINPTDPDEVFIGDKEYHLQTRDHADKTYYFLFDESSFEAFEGLALTGLIVVNLLILLGAGVLSVRLAARTMQPLSRISAQVADLDEAGSPIRTDLGLADHDEIQVLATTINRYHSRLADLLEREREFSSDVSHELRTPLMAMQGAIELIERQADGNEDLGKLAARVRRGCYQMTMLTEALLFLARGAASFKDSMEPVSVAGVVDTQIEAIKDIAHARGIELRVDRPGPDAVIKTVPAVIDIVVGNVLRNAVKYTDQNLVTIIQRGDEIVIQDYGPGIDQPTQAGLFDRYNRGIQRDPDGSGIGLALVKRFCEHFGWEITFRSEIKKGTRVALAF